MQIYKKILILSICVALILSDFGQVSAQSCTNPVLTLDYSTNELTEITPQASYTVPDYVIGSGVVSYNIASFVSIVPDNMACPNMFHDTRLSVPGSSCSFQTYAYFGISPTVFQINASEYSQLGQQIVAFCYKRFETITIFGTTITPIVWAKEFFTITVNIVEPPNFPRIVMTPQLGFCESEGIYDLTCKLFLNLDQVFDINLNVSLNPTFEDPSASIYYQLTTLQCVTANSECTGTLTCTNPYIAPVSSTPATFYNCISFEIKRLSDNVVQPASEKIFMTILIDENINPCQGSNIMVSDSSSSVESKLISWDLEIYDVNLTQNQFSSYKVMNEANTEILTQCGTLQFEFGTENSYLPLTVSSLTHIDNTSFSFTMVADPSQILLSQTYQVYFDISSVYAINGVTTVGFGPIRASFQIKFKCDDYQFTNLGRIQYYLFVNDPLVVTSSTCLDVALEIQSPICLNFYKPTGNIELQSNQNYPQVSITEASDGVSYDLSVIFTKQDCENYQTINTKVDNNILIEWVNKETGDLILQDVSNTDLYCFEVGFNPVVKESGIIYQGGPLNPSPCGPPVLCNNSYQFVEVSSLPKLTFESFESFTCHDLAVPPDQITVDNKNLDNCGTYTLSVLDYASSKPVNFELIYDPIVDSSIFTLCIYDMPLTGEGIQSYTLVKEFNDYTIAGAPYQYLDYITIEYIQSVEELTNPHFQEDLLGVYKVFLPGEGEPGKKWEFEFPELIYAHPENIKWSFKMEEDQSWLQFKQFGKKLVLLDTSDPRIPKEGGLFQCVLTLTSIYRYEFKFNFAIELIPPVSEGGSLDQQSTIQLEFNSTQIVSNDTDTQQGKSEIQKATSDWLKYIEDLEKANIQQEQYKLNQPKAVIKSISKYGLVEIRFSKAMIIVNRLEIIEKGTFESKNNNQAEPFFEVSIIPGLYSENQNLKFEWTITSMTSTSLLIQLNFEKAVFVSSNQFADIIKIQINDPNLFMSRDFYKLSDENQKIQNYDETEMLQNLRQLQEEDFKLSLMFELPPQIQLNSVEQRIQQSIEEFQDVAIKLALGNFAMDATLTASLQQIWSMINVQQLIVILPLFEITMPANAQDFLGSLMQIAAFDILETGEYLDEFLGLEPEPSSYVEMELLGFQSIYFVNNLGTLIFWPLMYFTGCVLYLITECFKEKSIRCRKRGYKLQETLFYSSLFTMIKESYIIVVICLVIYMPKFEFSSKGLIFNSTIALIYAILVFLGPVYLLGVTYLNFNKFSNRKNYGKSGIIKRKYGSTVEELRLQEGKKVILYSVFFYVRRLLLVASVTLISKLFIVQIFMFAFQIITAVFIISFTNPLKTQTMKKFEYYNEVSLMLVMYCIMCFSDFLTDPWFKFQIGNVVILVVGTHLFVNLGTMMLENIRKAKFRLKYWKVMSNYAKQREIRLKMLALQHEEMVEQLQFRREQNEIAIQNNADGLLFQILEDESDEQSSSDSQDESISSAEKSSESVENIINNVIEAQVQNSLLISSESDLSNSESENKKRDTFFINQNWIEEEQTQQKIQFHINNKNLHSQQSNKLRLARVPEESKETHLMRDSFFPQKTWLDAENTPQQGLIPTQELITKHTTLNSLQVDKSRKIFIGRKPVHDVTTHQQDLQLQMTHLSLINLENSSSKVLPYQKLILQEDSCIVHLSQDPTKVHRFPISKIPAIQNTRSAITFTDRYEDVTKYDISRENSQQKLKEGENIQKVQNSSSSDQSQSDLRDEEKKSIRQFRKLNLKNQENSCIVIESQVGKSHSCERIDKKSILKADKQQVNKSK